MEKAKKERRNDKEKAQFYISRASSKLASYAAASDTSDTMSLISSLPSNTPASPSLKFPPPLFLGGLCWYAAGGYPYPTEGYLYPGGGGAYPGGR